MTGVQTCALPISAIKGDGVVNGSRVGNLEIGQGLVSVHDLLGDPYAIADESGDYVVWYPGIEIGYYSGKVEHISVGSSHWVALKVPPTDLTLIPALSYQNHEIVLGVTTRQLLELWYGQPLCYHTNEQGAPRSMTYRDIGFEIGTKTGQVYSYEISKFLLDGGANTICK